MLCNIIKKIAVLFAFLFYFRIFVKRIGVVKKDDIIDVLPVWFYVIRFLILDLIYKDVC